ncbi:tenascin isoform X1 [Osmerus eperlanus]|uniref:tenascin isoform X1 n=1 Tax=Osmerus eperlanus TaxID=29151 RepID=UPI002E1210FF
MPLLRPFLFLLLASPALFTSPDSSLQTGVQRSPRDASQPIKVQISEGCVQMGDSSDSSQSGGVKELDLEPGSPLILTHRIRLMPSSGSGSGSCGCEADFEALKARIERLEREVSELREKCGGPEGGCCTSQSSTGSHCTRPECPNECSDQGRCEDGKCVCFPGFSGPDCSMSDCPGNCHDKGKCVNGQCVCDPGFTGPDCSQSACPGNCNNKGKCVNGKCVCDTGFTGPDCSQSSCPGNCNNKGRCVNAKCVCDTGFTGPDCSTKACPGNCNNKGRCVNGKCVCDTGFTGPDCSTKACPGNCNNKGRCVNGKCVCDTGFTGPDCSTKACPGNCNNKGKCVNGKCVCDTGFTGPDCSTKACPGNCNNKGRCVNGKCVCDTGFTGPDCLTKSCPGDCSDRGQCVDGKCVCATGFTGPDCSQNACPGNCNNKGKCVNGKCVCDIGFTGPDCSQSSCPGNCNNKGRCVRGKCVCRRGFTGPDCSECEAGFTGADCSTAMTGVSELSTKDITEDSVTLFWTPPAVQYDTYHITFTSKKESDQQVTAQVDGKQSTFPQSGLAAGQEYTVTVQGEVGGKRGGESSAEFQTLISGPKNLHVVKTTTTSVVVQWEQPQGEIDRYRLSVAPNEAAGSAKGSQELTLPPERDSAQIDGLVPGVLYDITLVAERGRSKSKPATVQATPGKPTKTISRVTMETVTTQVIPQQEVGEGGDPEVKTHHETTISAAITPWLGAQGRRGNASDLISERVGGTVQLRSGEGTSVTARTRPLADTKDRVVSKPGMKWTPARKPNTVGSLRQNGTRVGPGQRLGPLRRPMNRPLQTGLKERKTLGTGDSQPEHPQVGDRTLALTVKNLNLEETSFEEEDGPGRRTGPHPDRGHLEKVVPHGLHSEKLDVSSSSKEEAVAPDFNDPSGESTKKAPNRTELRGNNSTAHPNGKKCFKKLKVTHIRVGGQQQGDTGGSSAVNGEPESEKVPKVGITTLSLTGDVKQTEILERNLIDILTKSEEDSSQHSSDCPTHMIPSFYPIPSYPLTDSSSHSQSSSSSAQAKQEKSMTGTPVSQPTTDQLSHRTTLSSTPSHPTNLPPDAEKEREPMSSSESSSSSSSTSERSHLVDVTDVGASREAESDEGGVGELGQGKVGDRSAAQASPETGGTQSRPQGGGGTPLFFRRPNPKGTYPRRQHPNMGQPQNRTRLNMGPLQRPRRPNMGTFQNRTHLNTGPIRGGAHLNIGSLKNKTHPNVAEDTKHPNMEQDRTHPSMEQSQNRTQPNIGFFQNRTRPNLRHPQHPHRGPQRRPFPHRPSNGVKGTVVGIQTSQSKEEGVDYERSTETETDTAFQPHTPFKGKQTPVSDLSQGHTQIRNNNSQSEWGLDSKPGHGGKERGKVIENLDDLDSERGGEDMRKALGSDITTTAEDTGKSLDSVGVQDVTSQGFTLVWGAPEGTYKNFVVTQREQGGEPEGREETEGVKEEEDGSEGVSKEESEEKEEEDKIGGESKNRKENLESNVLEGRDKEGKEGKSDVFQTQRGNSRGAAKLGDTGSAKEFSKVLPGSARSFQFQNLPSQTSFSLWLVGRGPGIRSKIHRLVISTGPEPPSDLVFSEVTENSVTVSWTRPKSSVSGFKVTYTHTQDGEPVSVAVGSEDSTLGLAKLSPGSTYEVSVISVLGLDESDPINDFVTTLPDPPTDLRAINVTDTKALLLWRPALATVDRYVIIYGTGKGPGLTVKVSGNAAEQQLQGLQGSTSYTVTITSQLGDVSSSEASTTFTTSSGSGGDREGPRDLKASQVTPRSALVSWKASSSPVGSYKLTYFTEGQEMKEITLDPTVTEYKLTRLRPTSKYTVKLQGERGGRYTSTISTEFTTGTLRFPFPSDCSQELLNGILDSGEVDIFPKGKEGPPLQVYCDMETDGGGWTVFQRRRDGSTDFFRDRKTYSAGFGELNNEFWLGNENLYILTSMAPMTLRVDLRAGSEAVYAKYSSFSVEKRKYVLRVSGYSGTAGDSMSYHSDQPFSTKDYNPNRWSITVCAMSYRGGWWYKNCHEANLNGLYGVTENHQGVIWTAWKGNDFSIPFTEMKFRPTAFNPPARG